VVSLFEKTLEKLKREENNTTLEMEARWELLQQTHDLPIFQTILQALENNARIYRPKSGFIDTI
jgi:hypothetical protein